MKNLFALIILLSSISVSNAQLVDSSYNKLDSLGKQQGYWKTMMADIKGNILYLYSIESYKDGKLDGLSTFYYPNGNIQNERIFKADSLVGQGKFFRPDKSLMYIETYKNERLNGIKRWYDDSSILSSEEMYENGGRNGVARTYYKSGYVKSEVTLVNGKEEGGKQIYRDSEKRELIKEYGFLHGVLISVKYIDDGKVIKEEQYDYNKQLEEYNKTVNTDQQPVID